MAMGVRHRVDQLQEELQPRFQRQRCAGLVDGPALHVLHDEVGQAVGRASGVDEVRDVRVLQARQRLLLLRKAGQHRRAVHAAAQHLDRRLTLVRAVGALGQPDVAHAAGAKHAQQPPRAQRLAFATDLGLGLQRRRQRQEGVGRVAHLEGQQRAHLGHHGGVVRRVLQQLRALDRAQQQGALEEGAHGVPGWRGHGVGKRRGWAVVELTQEAGAPGLMA